MVLPLTLSIGGLGVRWRGVALSVGEKCDRAVDYSCVLRDLLLSRVVRSSVGRVMDPTCLLCRSHLICDSYRKLLTARKGLRWRLNKRSSTRWVDTSISSR